MIKAFWIPSSIRFSKCRVKLNLTRLEIEPISNKLVISLKQAERTRFKSIEFFLLTSLLASHSRATKPRGPSRRRSCSHTPTPDTPTQPVPLHGTRRVDAFTANAGRRPSLALPSSPPRPTPTGDAAPAEKPDRTGRHTRRPLPCAHAFRFGSAPPRRAEAETRASTSPPLLRGRPRPRGLLRQPPRVPRPGVPRPPPVRRESSPGAGMRGPARAAPAPRPASPGPPRRRAHRPLLQVRPRGPRLARAGPLPRGAGVWRGGELCAVLPRAVGVAA
jgi:hypothetical protein